MHIVRITTLATSIVVNFLLNATVWYALLFGGGISPYEKIRISTFLSGILVTFLISSIFISICIYSFNKEKIHTYIKILMFFPFLFFAIMNGIRYLWIHN
jgi:hypothetical protein